MQNITGNPVDGDDFYGREHELKQLRECAEAGNHVLLVGPRRLGKSSLVLELGRHLKKDGWHVVSADVQHSADEAAFLHELNKAIHETEIELPLKRQASEAIQRFRDFVRGTKVAVAGTSVELADTPADWESAATSLRSLIESLPDENRRVLIAVDELPIFLNKLLALDNGRVRVQAILDWLRSVRQANGRRLPWILCGSIGLDSFVAKHGLSGSINELLPVSVEAFDDPQAIGLLQTLGDRTEHDCPVSVELAERIIEKAGWAIPYYLQLLFHGLKSIPASKRSEDFPHETDLTTAYEELLGPHHRSHFGNWDTRLGDLLEAEEEANARSVLDHLADHPGGRTREQLRAVLARTRPLADPAHLDRQLRDLLDFLERDGYLGQRDHHFAFRSFLLRDYWQRRFGV